jgi:hypothetical protein
MSLCRYNLRVRLYKPRSASLLQTFTSWLSGMPAEFSDPKFPSYAEGREGARAGRRAVCLLHTREGGVLTDTLVLCVLGCCMMQ